MAKEDVSNRTVLILTLIVVIIVASSMWLVLNKLSEIEFNEVETKTLTITKVIEKSPPSGGVVGLSILPRPEGGG